MRTLEKGGDIRRRGKIKGKRGNSISNDSIPLSHRVTPEESTSQLKKKTEAYRRRRERKYAAQMREKKVGYGTR